MDLHGGRRRTEAFALDGMIPAFQRSTAVQRLTVALFVFATIGILVGPLLAPHDPLIPVGSAFQPPRAAHLMGTDQVGRDILTRVLHAMRSTGLAAAIVIAVAVTLGTVIGLLAGTAGGLVDAVLMRLTDLFLALPAPILALALVTALGASFVHVLIAVTIVWWPYYARITRAQVRELVTRPYYEAAQALGAGPVRLWRKHLLPGLVPVIIVAAGGDVGAAITTIAGLSFLGLGAPQPVPELGSMTANGLSYLISQWWIAVFPALAVFLLAFLSNLTADTLSDMLDQWS